MLNSICLAVALVLTTAPLPTAAADSDKSDPTIELQVAKDASITFQGEKLSLAELATKLKDMSNKAGTTVILLCHPDARTGEIQAIIRRLQEVGYEKFTLRAVIDCQEFARHP